MIVEVMMRGEGLRADVSRGSEPGDDAFQITLEGATATVRFEPLAGSEWWRLEVNGAATPVRVRRMGPAARETTVLVTLGAVRVPLEVRRWLPVRSRQSHIGSGERRIEVRAPMPGLVTATPLPPGDGVVAGATVAVVEAMKMQMEVPSPASGQIEDVRVRPGEEVAGGQVLVVVQASAADEARGTD